MDCVFVPRDAGVETSTGESKGKDLTTSCKLFERLMVIVSKIKTKYCEITGHFLSKML